MNCKNCGWEIPSENINIQLAVAKCDNCNAVFSFYDDVAPRTVSAEPAAGSPDETPRDGTEIPEPKSGRFAAAPLPRGVSLEDTGMELRIKRRWFAPHFLFLTFFTAIWDIFLVVWFFIAFAGGLYGMAAAGAVHLLVGIGLTYYTLAGYLNSTIVAVNEDYIVVHHAPLPWRGARTIQAEDVEKLVSRGTGVYSVHAVLKDGQDFRLIGGLRDETQALYIEQEAARYLRPGKFRL